MNWEKFKFKFHPSWHQIMKPLIESEDCDKIYTHLKERAKVAEITPESNNTFRCFLETPLDELKVVIVGLCPYHSKVNNVIVADGLAMSCSITGRLQPSLEKFYDAIEKDIYNGLNLNGYRDPSLLDLAHQGVLLFNAALTTEIGTAAAHQQIWEPFTKHVLTHIKETGVPVLLLGKQAQEFSYIFPPEYPVFHLKHPAYASYRKEDWDTEGKFKKVDKMIEQTGDSILWMVDDIPF